MVYLTCKAFLIIYTSSYTSFPWLKSRKISLFFHTVDGWPEWNSGPLGFVDQSKNYTIQVTHEKICATFGVCLKFLTLLVFEISGKLHKKKEMVNISKISSV